MINDKKEPDEFHQVAHVVAGKSVAGVLGVDLRGFFKEVEDQLLPIGGEEVFVILFHR